MVQVSLTLPVPLAVRRAQARRGAMLVTLATTAGCALTPVALMLLPLVASRTWRAGAGLVAGVLLVTGLVLGWRWIDIPAVAIHPATLTGPWITLLVGASVAAASWSAADDRPAADALRGAAAIALLAAPWSPYWSLLVAASSLALSRRLAPSPSPKPCAANDNHPRCSPPTFHSPPLSYWLPRSAHPSAFD